MHPKDAEGIANSADPDQTAPLGAVWSGSARGAVWSGSALFAQTCLSENLGKLQYYRNIEAWTQRYCTAYLQKLPVIKPINVLMAVNFSMVDITQYGMLVYVPNPLHIHLKHAVECFTATYCAEMPFDQMNVKGYVSLARVT